MKAAHNSRKLKGALRDEAIQALSIPDGTMDVTGTFHRTLIVGNSGSGKSWLAGRLADAFGVPPLDLDFVHWEPDGYGMARPKDLAIDIVRQHAKRDRWIIEGVYGWLAREVVSQATALIWLDVPVDDCIANIMCRGLRRGGEEADLSDLLAWAGDYPARQTSSSFAGHRGLVEAFRGSTFRLSSRDATTRFLTSVGRRGHAVP